MPDEEHLQIIRQGVAVWNEWRQKNPELIPDLRKADLRKADLNRAKLSGAFLSDADLREARLSGSHLGGCQLIGKDLCGASLLECSVYGASVWDIKVNDQTNQQNLVITPSGIGAITVDNIKVAQFIYTS